MRKSSEYKHNIITSLKNKEINVSRACIKLDCDKRSIYRMLKEYVPNNCKCYEHKNKGKEPWNKIDKSERKQIVHLKKTKYKTFSFTHFAEEYNANNNKNYCADTISNICYESYVTSKCTHKSTIRLLEKQAKTVKENKSLILQEQTIYQDLILLKKDQHCRKQIKPIFGNVIEIDASEYKFFGNKNTHLHLFVDQATNTTVAGYFDEQETLAAYRNCFAQMIRKYGIPVMFVTDCRSCFTNNRTDNEHSRLIQFNCWCDNAGIELYSTTVSQRKPRVERRHRIFQDRLTAELSLYKIKTIDEANKILPKIIDKINKKFAKKIEYFENAFAKYDEKRYGTVETFLSYRRTRKVGNGSTFQVDHQSYYICDPITHKIINVLPQTKILVLFSMDNKVAVNIHNKFYGAIKCGTYNTEKIDVITFPATNRLYYTLENFLDCKFEHPIEVNELYEKPLKSCL